MSNIQWHRTYITISKERNRCIERKYQTKARLNLIRALIKCSSSMANVKRFRRLHPSGLAVYNILLSHTRWHNSQGVAPLSRCLTALSFQTSQVSKVSQTSHSKLHGIASHHTTPRPPGTLPPCVSDSMKVDSTTLFFVHLTGNQGQQHVNNTASRKWTLASWNHICSRFGLLFLSRSR